ncbi:MAG: NAD(P)/FAD-dependent oxidoreductase [Rhodothermales bacterium]
MPLDRSQTVLISGAGLAGSLLALALAQRGFRVEVFEKRPDLRLSSGSAGRSINLALSARGMHALEGVGLLDRILKGTIPMRGRILHARNGALEVLPYGQNKEEVIRSVSRRGLNEMLLNALDTEPNATVHFGHGVTDYEPSTGTVSVEGPDGRTESRVAPVLFAADGAGSPVRQALERQAGIVVTQDMLSHGYKELEIPPLSDGTFRIDPHALHIWPRGTGMLIALPNQDGTFTCTLFLPHDEDPGFNQLNSPYLVMRYFEDQFADALPHLPGLRHDFMNNPTGQLGTIRCDRWHVGGRVLLLGDAAHAIVPFFGQGMNCAFEDVSELMALVDEDAPGWQDVFDRFTAARIPNANAIADMALENYIEMRDSVADPAFQLRRAVALELERRHPDRFIPRYSLVSFHRIPYIDARAAGEIQSGILHTLCDAITDIDEVDWALADRLIDERLAPFDELA